MTFETALKIARRNITTNGAEILIRDEATRTTYARPVRAGMSARLDLANTRRNEALTMAHLAH